MRQSEAKSISQPELDWTCTKITLPQMTKKQLRNYVHGFNLKIITNQRVDSLVLIIIIKMIKIDDEVEMSKL